MTRLFTGIAAMTALLAIGTLAAEPPQPKAEKVEVAMQSAIWTVKAGEHLYAICRRLTGGAGLARCVGAIHAQNPHAFFGGDPGRLVPGARLDIPAPYRIVARDVAPIASHPPSPAVATTSTPALLDAPATSEPSQPPPARRKPAPQAPFRDALIGDAVADDDPVDTGGPGRRPESGQRFVSVEYAADVYRDQAPRRGSEQSLALQYRRETENAGEWFIDAAGRHTTGPQNAPLDSGRSGGRATLYHNAFPLTEQLVANSALGVIRSPLNTLVSNSFRVNLPSPLYAGLAVDVGDGTREFRIAAGHIGVLDGFGGSAFDTTRGQFASAGANLRLGEQWQVGMQSMHIRDALALPDHHSVAAAIDHLLPGRTGKWALHALADSKGQRGAWVDADLSWDLARHRFGAYHLDPGLLWADAQIANDQRGLYWRADQRGLRQSLFGGISYADSNLERLSGRGGQQSVDGFAGITLRIDRSLSVGGTLSIQATAPHSVTGGLSKAGAGSGFVSFNGPLGATRLDVARHLVRPARSAREFVDTMGVSHDWSLAGGFAIASALNASREHGAFDTTRRESLSLALRSPPFSDFHWDVSLALARVANARGVEKNVNASLSSFWQVSANWLASLQLVWNTIDPAPPLPGAGADTFKREKRLHFTLRHEQTSGTPFAALGIGRPGQAGTGRIGGVVFYDENGDGIRQANERGAANLTVYLDGRIPATTDGMGRYRFASVPTGSHTLLLLADTLLLPWTLEDDKGFKVQVPLRGEVAQDIPLVRLGL